MKPPGAAGGLTASLAGAAAPPRTARRLTWLAVLVVLAPACASGRFAHRRDIHADLAAGHYAEALATLEAHVGSYGDADGVLFHLNEGALAHYAAVVAPPAEQRELLRRSEAAFSRAERLMDDLYTRRIGREAASLLTADTALPYEGAPHERIQLHVFRALNWLLLGDVDEALVEARKLHRRLRALRERGDEGRYRDDPFARLLMGLLYEAAGDDDDAMIAYRAALAAYAEQAGLTAARPPGWLGPALVRLCTRARDVLAECAPGVEAPGVAPSGPLASVVIVEWSGRAPLKVEERFQISVGEGMAFVHAARIDDDEAQDVSKAVAGAGALLGNTVTVAWPALAKAAPPRPLRVRAGRAADEQEVPPPAAPAQDVAGLVNADFEALRGTRRGRAIARTVVKFVLARLAGKAAEKASGKEELGLLVFLLGSVAMSAAEEADTRSWFTLPAAIRIRRVDARPGVVTLEIERPGVAPERLRRQLGPGQFHWVVVPDLR